MPFDIHKFLINALLLSLIVLVILVSYYVINIGNKKIETSNQLTINLKSIRKYIILILLLFALLYLFNRYPIMLATVWTLVGGMVLAYVINPLVVRLERRGIQRAFSILIIYFSFILLFVVLGILVLPQTFEQLKQMLLSIPEVSTGIYENITNFFDSYMKNHPQMKTLFMDTVDDLAKNLGTWRISLLDRMTNISNENGVGVFTNIVRVVLVPILSFYILLDKEKLIAYVKGFIPKNHRKKFLEICRDMDDAYSKFIRGRLLMAAFVGIATMIFLIIIRVDFALVIGVLTFLGDIIPFIGPLLALIPAFVISFIQSPIKALFVAVVFVLIQWVENNILAPKLLGSQVGINPIIILFSLIIGGSILGVWGMIFSVPIVSTFMILYRHFKEPLKSFFYDK